MVEQSRVRAPHAAVLGADVHGADSRDVVHAAESNKTMSLYLIARESLHVHVPHSQDQIRTGPTGMYYMSIQTRNYKNGIAHSDSQDQEPSLGLKSGVEDRSKNCMTTPS